MAIERESSLPRQKTRKKEEQLLSTYQSKKPGSLGRKGTVGGYSRCKSEGKTKKGKKERKEEKKEGRKRRGGSDSTRILGARARQFCGPEDAFTISDIYRTARGAFFFADLGPTRQTPQGLSHLLLSTVLSLGINWARPVRLRGKRERERERENGSLVYGDGTPYPRNRMNFCLCDGVSPPRSHLSFTPWNQAFSFHDQALLIFSSFPGRNVERSNLLLRDPAD